MARNKTWKIHFFQDLHFNERTFKSYKSKRSFAFDFKLSGELETMNFLWLESAFKKRLQDAIPGFIERKIERDIEKAIESISR